MNTLHIANTYFEKELSESMGSKAILPSQPVFLQLQYLPFLYANPGDAILSCGIPDPSYGRLRKNHRLPHLEILTNWKEGLKRLETWGHSESIALVAHQYGIPYQMPSRELVQKVNSKAFSFEHSPPLPQAALLHSKEEIRKWVEVVKGPKVLKTCFGVSGQGHLLFEDLSDEKLAALPPLKEPLIGEPWVERVLDFSTQWEIFADGSIAYIGATVCENTPKGKYQASVVGNEISLFSSSIDFLHEHKKHAIAVLQKMSGLGFYGNVGIDAMLYRNNSKITLHPIVEINARKTMGWVALMFQRKHFPNNLIALSFTRSEEGLLPSSVTLENGKKIAFLRNLTVEKRA